MFNIANLKPIAGRGLLLVQKHSPEILTAVGVASVVTAGVIASRATLKLPAMVDNKNHMIEAAKAKNAAKILENPESVTEKEYNKDIAEVYVRSGLDVTKLYAPAVTLGIGGVICILGAHGIMRRRNVAIMAAYKVVQESFDEYRKRVAEQIGEDGERDIRLNRFEETVVNEETGEEEKTNLVHTGHSPYAKFFDEFSSQWQKDSNYNLMFLTQAQTQLNMDLHRRGHVFLSEVYDALDIPRTPESTQVGWLANDLMGGDQEIDFGLYNIYDEKKRLFVNGHERAVLLDFNVDGVIWDKI